MYQSVASTTATSEFSYKSRQNVLSCDICSYKMSGWGSRTIAEKNFIECSEMCQNGKKAHQNQYIPTV